MNNTVNAVMLDRNKVSKIKVPRDMEQFHLFLLDFFDIGVLNRGRRIKDILYGRDGYIYLRGLSFGWFGQYTIIWQEEREEMTSLEFSVDFTKREFDPSTDFVDSKVIIVETELGEFEEIDGMVNFNKDIDYKHMEKHFNKGFMFWVLKRNQLKNEFNTEEDLERAKSKKKEELTKKHKKNKGYCN